jgi:hypothetical protein
LIGVFGSQGIENILPEQSNLEIGKIGVSALFPAAPARRASMAALSYMRGTITVVA